MKGGKKTLGFNFIVNLKISWVTLGHITENQKAPKKYFEVKLLK